MTESMVERLAEAARLLRERGDELSLAVADWMDEERREVEFGDPECLCDSALRVADLVRAGR